MSKLYYYPGSEVLINKLGIKDANKLAIAERKLTTGRLVDLHNNPIVGEFDLKHFQKIHKYIFQDLYEWAGKIRSLDIGKGNWFCYYQYIPDEAERIFGSISKDQYLKNLDIDPFSEKIAYYSGEINALHPFLEGNGRSTREFIRCLSNNAGYSLDFSKISTDRLFNAFVKSFYGDYTYLKDLFKQNIIENIQYEYDGQFPEDFKVTESILDNLHKLKLSSRENKYMTLERIKDMGEVISESNMNQKPIYKVVLDINKELNNTQTKGENNNLRNNINNDFQL